VKPLVFHRQAEEEYLAAVEYYERQRRGLGLDFQEEVERGTAAIRRDPERYPAYEDPIRQFVLRRFPYSILYAELADRIWLVAVAHHKRRPGYWKRRKPE